MSRRPSWLVRWLRRSPQRVPKSPAAAEAPVPPGPRRERWLVVAAGDPGHRQRAARLAAALAGSGLPVTLVFREPSGGSPSEVPGLPEPEPWSLATLRERFRGGVDRLRVLIGAADAETIALARDLGEYGARVAYDAPAAGGGPAGWYAADTERALVDVAEDLIAADASTARHLSKAGGGRRLVHVLPDSPDSDASATVGTLTRIGARPAAAVLLAASASPAEATEAACAFERARSDGAYRLIVIVSAADRNLQALEEMEEEGRLRLLRSARPGRAAAWNLGMSATRSEIVAMVHASQRPDGEGWLAPALDVLGERRELGGVGLRAGVPPDGVAKDGDGGDARVLRVAALDAPGLVAPRSALRRAGGLDESLGALSSIDLAFRLREMGLELALCPRLGLSVAAEESADRRAGDVLRELRRRWAHRPAYLAGGPG